MLMGNWTLESISWDRFDASKVDPEILRNIKAAALVERNGGDYGIYLDRIFADDASFRKAVDIWVREQIVADRFDIAERSIFVHEAQFHRRREPRSQQSCSECLFRDRNVFRLNILE